jgi:mannose-1-phosphate guanylyltransferase/mannose-6-phosphate isomerase
MLQDTILRLAGFEGLEEPIIVCNEVHRFLVAEQMREVGCFAGKIILEPVGRNTAPAIAIAALSVEPGSILIVLPADHSVSSNDKFQEYVTSAIEIASTGKLVTFGIVPTSPETGYGYIRAGKPTTDSAYIVEQFVEKPDLDTAKSYLAEGCFSWNSGMFVFSAEAYLGELDKQRPNLLRQCKNAFAGISRDLDFMRLNAEQFSACESISIDYAVMENTTDAIVIPIDVGWNDVGSWSSLWEVGERDPEGNSFLGDVLSHDSHRNYVNAQQRLIALVGVDDLIVVDTDDALLVASRSRSQDVKEIVAKLKLASRKETSTHRKVYRPWGSYDSVDEDVGFQVKRIMVNPGASLSLQKHHHRAEHWIVVSGTAEVTRGDDVFLVTKNESTYIPIGEKHRLRNPGKIPLKLIEVQSGDYLGEDDIERFDDVYGRAKPVPSQPS